MMVSPVNAPEAPGRTMLPPATMELLPALVPLRTQAPLATVRAVVIPRVIGTAVALLLSSKAPMVALAGAVTVNAAAPVAAILMMSLAELTTRAPAAAKGCTM